MKFTMQVLYNFLQLHISECGRQFSIYTLLKCGLDSLTMQTGISIWNHGHWSSQLYTDLEVLGLLLHPTKR